MDGQDKVDEDNRTSRTDGRRRNEMFTGKGFRTEASTIKGDASDSAVLKRWPGTVAWQPSLTWTQLSVCVLSKA
jgi:hypothetical protein